MNINVRVDNACELIPGATGQKNAMMVRTNETALVKGTKSNVGMVLVLISLCDVTVEKTAAHTGRTS